MSPRVNHLSHQAQRELFPRQAGRGELRQKEVRGLLDGEITISLPSGPAVSHSVSSSLRAPCLLHSLGADHANPLGRAAADMGTFLWLLLLSLLREGERDCSWGQPGLPPALFCWTSAGKPCPLGWNASALLEVSVA